MMNKILYIFSSLLISSITLAQNSEKAEILLHEVSSKIDTYSNVSIKFKYTLENKEIGLKQESMGYVSIQNEKYNLNFMDNIIIHDGSKTYIIMPEDEEINIIDGDSEDMILSPSKLLYFYKEGYNYSWDMVKKSEEKTIQYVKLTPINSKSESSHFLIGINTEDKQIYTITDVGTNGTQTIFEIQDFKPNQAISENLFIFDKQKYTQENYTINE